MIQNHCFDRAWIDSKQSELGLRDPGLLEKCIHALQLLGTLAESSIPFVFKGGTAMVLLLERLRRLSIDIDIVSESPEAVDIVYLRELFQNSRFVRIEEDNRGDHHLPHRRHFKFFYTSVYSSIDNYVMLDVLQERNLYPVTRLNPIRASFIEAEREIEVLLPTIDALLADKLTAFAPNTVGVRLDDEYNMQVIKQVVDVGELFTQAVDLTLIRQAYAVICDAEIGYRGGAFTSNQALHDTLQTALQISEIRLGMGGEEVLKRWRRHYSRWEIKSSMSKYLEVEKMLSTSTLLSISGSWRQQIPRRTFISSLETKDFNS